MPFDFAAWKRKQNIRYNSPLHIRRVHVATAQGKIREIMTAFRKDGCATCGENHPACLVAHHINPAEKEYEIAKLSHGIGSRKKLVAELQKCICLCHNCHYKLHAGER
jgi:hypothetical protein